MATVPPKMVSGMIRPLQLALIMVIGFTHVDFFGEKTRSHTKFFYIYFNWFPPKALYMKADYIFSIAVLLSNQERGVRSLLLRKIAL